MNAIGKWPCDEVRTVANRGLHSNTYLLKIDEGNDCVVVDPGLDREAIEHSLDACGWQPIAVLCTHGHFDHVGSAAYFQKKYGCQVFMHKADARTLKASNFLLMVFKIPQKIQLPDVTYIEDQFSIDLAGKPLTYHAAPGHTPGSCVIEFGDAWFTGDTIYSRGVGLSALPGEDAELLKQSIRGLWDRLTCDRIVYPGHGNAADGESIRSENHALLKFMGLV